MGRKKTFVAFGLDLQIYRPLQVHALEKLDGEAEQVDETGCNRSRRERSSLHRVRKRARVYCACEQDTACKE